MKLNMKKYRKNYGNYVCKMTLYIAKYLCKYDNSFIRNVEKVG